MVEKSEDPKEMMPTEWKSTWKTIEERKMSDLTRVLEWMERRQGKKSPIQKAKQGQTLPKEKVKEEKKAKGILKQQGENCKMTRKRSRKERDPVTYQRLYGVETKGKRLSISPSNHSKENARKSDIDIKDVIAQRSESQRSNSYRRQSSFEPLIPESLFPNRKATLSRDWAVKMSDTTYERKLKSLMEKGTEPKIETIRMLKPEEVLSCRYLRLSRNNIRTLLKLCKDAGMTVDIHPHMVEGEIDAKKVFSRSPSIAL